MPRVVVDDEISGNSDLLVVVIDDYLQLPNKKEIHILKISY